MGEASIPAVGRGTGSPRPIDAVHAATPRPPELFVPRPRLDEFLGAVPQFTVNLVVAPAGSGKTAAAAAWTDRATRSGAAVTWVRATDVDQLARELARATAAGPVLVVDDAHLLPAVAARMLGRVLEEDPGSVRLLLLSRRDLDFVPVTLALAGQVRSLRVDDLRFTDAEAAELVRAHHPGADPDDIAAILGQSDGWAAAVVLGARTLLTASDTADARAALAATGRPALDYLVNEVVASFPPELTHVLLSTCQLPYVTSEEAVLLSGAPSAGTLLAGAAAAGLLVTTYRDEDDPHPRAWRYHPLLLDLLRRRAAPTGPDRARVVAAHYRAAAHYGDVRDPERAVQHAGLTGDLDLQLRVLREFAVELMTRGSTSLVAQVLAEIPADVRARHRELLVLHATVLHAQGRVDAAKMATDRALAADQDGRSTGVARDVEAQLGSLMLWQARSGWRDPAPAISRAERVLGCRHEDGDVGTHDIAGMSPLSAAWLALELAMCQTWLGQQELAAVHVQIAAMYSRQAGLSRLERTVLSQRAVLELIAEAYQSAVGSAEASLALWRADGSPPDAAGAGAHLVRAWGRLQELRLGDAEGSLAELEAMPRAHVDPLLLVYGRLLRACLLIARGEVEAARRLLDTRGEVPEQVPPFLSRRTHLVRLLAALAMSDVPGIQAEAYELQLEELPVEAGLAEALAVGLEGDEQRAVWMLDYLLPSTVDAPPSVALAVSVARAAFLDRIGNPSSVRRARLLVPDMLGRAAPQRLLWMLSLGSLISPGFVDLVAGQATTAGAHPFAREALAALREHSRPYADRTHSGARPEVPEADGKPAGLLTPREREVLEHLALGGGNADLARSLFVSENTVKTHLTSIYRKLEVDRRVDALRVARARGLL